MNYYLLSVQTQQGPPNQYLGNRLVVGRCYVEQKRRFGSYEPRFQFHLLIEIDNMKLTPEEHSALIVLVDKNIKLLSSEVRHTRQNKKTLNTLGRFTGQLSLMQEIRRKLEN